MNSEKRNLLRTLYLILGFLTSIVLIVYSLHQTNIIENFMHAYGKIKVFRGDKDVDTYSAHENSTDTLSGYLYNFPWEEFEQSMNTRQELQYRQALIDGIQKFAYMEPLLPINSSCSPPPLLNSEDIRCSDYPDAFLQDKYTTPVKLAHAILLGFDADILEIHLNEVYEVIDQFFIIESPRVHCKLLR